jgi:2-phospho-L-lactate/phosphoenolpyruvate guanylyltransferase
MPHKRDLLNDRETWAVVALKSPDSAKSRLRPHLCETDRRALYYFMAHQVLSALRGTPDIAAVYAVTTSDEVERLAVQMGVQVIRRTQDDGTAAAFTHAVAALTRRAPPKRLLMIAGDLPLISPAELAPLLSKSSIGKSVCIVPDRKRVGTNALMCSPPDAIAPCFGARSFEKHLAAAAEQGIGAQVIESEALSLDIDVAEDLALLRNLRGAALDPALRKLLVGFRSTGTAAERHAVHDADAA